MTELSRRGLLVSALILAAAAPGAQRRPLRFKVTDLGTLPSGDYSAAYAINNRGQVIGLSSTGETIVNGLLRDTRAVMWQNGKIVDLVAKELMTPRAFRINDRGQVLIDWQYIGAGNGGVPPQEPYVALWDGRVRKVFRQTEGFLPTNFNSKGELVGYVTTGEPQPARWRDGAHEKLPMPRNAVSGKAMAISNTGIILGNFEPRPGASNAALFVLQDKSLRTLAPTQGRSYYYPGAINSTGRVVGTFRDPKTRDAHLFAWQDGRLTDLHIIGKNGEAHDVNSAGWTVGRAHFGAFFTVGGQPADLNAHIAPNSGWRLDVATGINDRCEIVGSGSFKGTTRAFLLTLEQT